MISDVEPGGKAGGKAGRKVGRPKIEIDESQVLKLAMIHCTASEIAAVLGCSQDTIERNCADALKKGRDQGRASLRRQQWALAQDGNPTMLIWLGKQLLGQREPKFQIVGDDTSPVEITLKIKDADEP